MTLQEKLNEIAHYDRCSFNMIARKSAMKMYKWTKEEVLDKACNLMHCWILEHDYVDIMELEDYVKQKMEE